MSTRQSSLDRPPGGWTWPDRALRFDLAAVAAGVCLVVAAALVGRSLLASGLDIFLPFPPLLANWEPHIGPGSVGALAIAAAVVRYGPRLAAAVDWRPLLALSWAMACGWTLFLALVDGWSRGVAGRLTARNEYLYDVPRVTDIPEMLRVFTSLIYTDPAVVWTTHVAGHPPGATLVFVWLDRVGLSGGGPAGLLCILVGSSAATGLAVTLRALGQEPAARRMLPFAVLFPGAVWVGVSADGMFAGVLAWGVALFALGCTRRGARADLAALAAGLVLGFLLYLSYGLVLAGLLPLVVLALTRAWRAAGLAVLGAAAVAAVFTGYGFWWFDGLERLRIAYSLSITMNRPYEYFVWINLAAVLFVLGPAVLAGLRRWAADPRALPVTVSLLALAGLAAIVAADLSGLSKGEVERIWLPFSVWLVLPCVLLPPQHVRGWLAAQAVLALAVNHLLLTEW
ncbi:MAG: hypothetical protein ACT4O0_18585 [Pseudonocardia sp.]